MQQPPSPDIFSSPPSTPLLAAFLLALQPLLPAVAAATFADGEVIGGDTIRFTAAADTANYYIFEQSADLEFFTGWDIALGGVGPVRDFTIDPAASPLGFFRVTRASIYAPLDSDGDLIDDLYELRHAALNPLDANDAPLDPDRNGLSYLEEYLRAIFATDALQFYSREVTTFNVGARVESALSREVTSFNFGEPSAPVEAISREVSVLALAPEE